ncbi:YihY family inner membrane protein [Rothia dentocariosa]|uniref:YihY family inner membrane protein n=1 Tax=Rothia dentocariosa TaxID=2047 RepID=A0A448UUW7_9MICC|nr:YihY family inner membrane protein [Rothia dentocariosa]
MPRSIVPPHKKNYFLYYCSKYSVLLSTANKHQFKERSYGTTPQKITSSFRICKNTRFSSGQYRLYFSSCGFFLWSARGTDLAAALTYFTVLSAFPALLAILSLLGIFGQGEDSAKVILEFLQERAPQQMYSILEGPIHQLTNGQGAGFALIIGILSALWSASGYVGSFGRALNNIYGVREGRPAWLLIPYNVFVTTGL